MGSRRTTLGASTVHNVRHSMLEGRSKRVVRSGKDPRDLHDKNFQKQARQKVIAFLAEHRYPYEISPKTLSNQKDFYSVVWFVLGAIDAEVADLPLGERTTDALVSQLKRLKYPYVPPKSTLQAFNASIYWPAMLGMLDWLVARATMVAVNDKHKSGLLKTGRWVGNAPVASIITGDEEHIAEQRQQSERIELFAAGFCAHMKGDERGEVFDNLLQQERVPVLTLAQEAGERMQEEMDELVMKRDLLMQEPDTVSESLSKLESIRNVQNSVRDRISQLKAQVFAKQKETADGESRCRQLQLEVERDEREQDRVRMRIAEQPMQLKEVQAVRQDVRMVIKVRQNKAALAEDAELQAEAAREEYVEAVSDLERRLLSVNDRLARAKLHPACAEAANGVDYEVKLTSQIDTNVTLSVGMKDLVQPAIEQRMQDLLGKTKRHAQHLSFQHVRLKRAQEELKDEEQRISDTQGLIEDVEQKHHGLSAACRIKTTEMVQRAKHLEAAAEDCLKEAEAQFKTANEKRSNLLEKLAEETRSDKEAGLEEREALNKVASYMLDWSSEWARVTAEMATNSQRLAQRANDRQQAAVSLLESGAEIDCGHS